MNYDIPLVTLTGTQTSLETYRGKVLLIVNVASKCGLTPQYTELEALYRAQHARGFEVLGFPCNQFGAQEPGDADAIATFCSTNYDVTFPMFAKLEVNGAGRHALYGELTQVADAAGVAGNVKWNFEKFLVDRSGGIQRFRPDVTPSDSKLTQAIETALAAT